MAVSGFSTWVVTVYMSSLMLVTAQPYIIPEDFAERNHDRSALYVTPGDVVGNGGQVVGYQLSSAGDLFNQQPTDTLEQSLLDSYARLSEIFSQQTMPRQGLADVRRVYGSEVRHNRQSKYPIRVAGYGQSYDSTPLLQTKRPTSNAHGQLKAGYNQKTDYMKKSPTRGYGKKRQKAKVVNKPVYVPVPIKQQKKKKKKNKTLSVSKGFYIAGGDQVFGKFKTLKSCQKACDNTASCLGGDYDKWSRRCYMHTNRTACGSLQPHKKLTHFKKVPCSINDLGIGFGRITLGTRLNNGLLQKGVKDIQTCIKKCLQAGGGVPGTLTASMAATQILASPQLCFGIDYDFASHKCYFHTSVTVLLNDAAPIATPQLQGIPGGILCIGSSALTAPRTPTNLLADSSVVNIVICPQPATG